MSTFYNFLAVHPGIDESEEIAIAITDVATVSEFGARWERQPDKVQAEFGYDLPLHCNEHMVPLEDVAARNVKRRTYCSKVVEMTFDEYVALVKQYVE